MSTPARFDFVEKLGRFPERVRAVINRDLGSALSTVYLDLNTDICNHACTFCDGFYRPLSKAQIPWPRLDRLVDEMKELGVLAVVLAGDRGEPLLHPDIALLFERLAAVEIPFGVYTNGTVIDERLKSGLSGAAFLRVSADAASAETHRRLHAYPEGRKDFDQLLAHVAWLAARCPDVGVSFVLDQENYREILSAADVFLAAGAAFIEYKPKYLPGYSVDTAWLGTVRSDLAIQFSEARRRWGSRIVLNNQVATILDSSNPTPMQTTSRPCLTSLLRLVISTHGCYTCTPYRGEPERRVGDIFQQSLRSIVESSTREAVLARPCARLCAYHAQNEMLLVQDRTARNALGGGHSRPSADPQALFL